MEPRAVGRAGSGRGASAQGRQTRSLLIGRVGEQHWSAVVTHRDCRARIISVRSSPTELAGHYGEDKGGEEFDERFLARVDAVSIRDLATARRLGFRQRRVNVDLRLRRSLHSTERPSVSGHQPVGHQGADRRSTRASTRECRRSIGDWPSSSEGGWGSSPAWPATDKC